MNNDRQSRFRDGCRPPTTVVTLATFTALVALLAAISVQSRNHSGGITGMTVLRSIEGADLRVARTLTRRLAQAARRLIGAPARVADIRSAGSSIVAAPDPWESARRPAPTGAPHRQESQLHQIDLPPPLC